MIMALVAGLSMRHAWAERFRADRIGGCGATHYSVWKDCAAFRRDGPVFSIARCAVPDMYFHQELHEDCGCSAYIVGSRPARQVIVVDPAVTIAPYLELTQQHGFRIVAAIDTHTHADHVSGARALAAATGADLCLH